VEGIGGILYTLRNGVPSYTHYNSRGDVVAKTSSTGAITYQAQYEAFGKRPVETGSTLDRQKSNTKDTDPSGLVNEGFRYRDLDTGIFITRDPLGFVDGPNMYSYVRDNPWTHFDPEGLQLAPLVEEGGENLETKVVATFNYIRTEPERLPGQIAAAKQAANDIAKTVEKTAATVKNEVDKVVSKIEGNAQKTGTPGHAEASTRIAGEEASKEDIVSVHLNQELKTITKGDVDSKLRPDVTTVDKNGKVSPIEIPSKTQTTAQMQDKVQQMEKALGDKAGQGRVEPIQPHDIPKMTPPPPIQKPPPPSIQNPPSN
jgi:RHS repeat-associated protein